MKKCVVFLFSFLIFSIDVNATNILSTVSVDNASSKMFLSTETVDKDKVKLSKCVDGDTAWFILNEEKIKVRFLAIDTPESTNKIEPYGKEAAKYTCDMLTSATNIELEYDDESDKVDKYGRYLAWIIIDGENLQMKLVENGYAEVKYIYGNYKYLDEIKKLQKKAQEEKLNIWSEYQNNDYFNYIYVGIGIVVIIICLLIKNKRAAKKVFNKIKKRIN